MSHTVYNPIDGQPFTVVGEKGEGGEKKKKKSWERKGKSTFTSFETAEFVRNNYVSKWHISKGKESVKRREGERKGVDGQLGWSEEYPRHTF